MVVNDFAWDGVPSTKPGASKEALQEPIPERRQGGLARWPPWCPQALVLRRIGWPPSAPVGFCGPLFGSLRAALAAIASAPPSRDPVASSPDRSTLLPGAGRPQPIPQAPVAGAPPGKLNTQEPALARLPPSAPSCRRQPTGPGRRRGPTGQGGAASRSKAAALAARGVLARRPGRRGTGSAGRRGIPGRSQPRRGTAQRSCCSPQRSLAWRRGPPRPPGTRAQLRPAESAPAGAAGRACRPRPHAGGATRTASTKTSRVVPGSTRLDRGVGPPGPSQEEPLSSTRQWLRLRSNSGLEFCKLQKLMSEP